MKRRRPRLDLQIRYLSQETKLERLIDEVNKALRKKPLHDLTDVWDIYERYEEANDDRSTCRGRGEGCPRAVTHARAVPVFARRTASSPAAAQAKLRPDEAGSPGPAHR